MMSTCGLGMIWCRDDVPVIAVYDEDVQSLMQLASYIVQPWYMQRVYISQLRKCFCTAESAIDAQGLFLTVVVAQFAALA